jgi:uncharacterized OB-fold protein
MTRADAPAALATATDETDAIRAAADRVAAAGQSSPRPGRDPVNLAMIRNWIEAIGDASPVYTDAEFAADSVHGSLVAPPGMIQVWTMPGLHPGRAGDDPLGQMSQVLEAAGYTSVVATNCDQAYHRYLRLGEPVSVRASLVSVTGPKRTALGEGWFVTTRSTWYVGDEAVATMDFRILRFRPPAARAASPVPVMRPLVSPDTRFFWAGTAAGELRIQRCEGCGALRHPPGPMCPQCGSAQGGSAQAGSARAGSAGPGYVVAAGTGEVYSYVVHHHPPVPGKQLPIVVALVQLPEGVRMVGELLGARPDQVRVGLPVDVELVRVDDELTLPAWREAGPRQEANGSASRPAGHHPADRRPAEQEPAEQEPAIRQTADQQPAGRRSADAQPSAGGSRTATGAVLPELVIDVTTTFVVASAIATRDFQDVHHDRDRAVAGGSKDIFLNILTTTGLVERFVSGWAGPEAVFRTISIRLGVPCYGGDTLTFSGQVTDKDGSTCVVAVVGRCSLGDHVTGTVRIDVPGRRP